MGSNLSIVLLNTLSPFKQVDQE